MTIYSLDVLLSQSWTSQLFHVWTKHNHRKLNKLITRIPALSNSMKLWAMLCRATQDGRIMVECSDKTCSAGEGNGLCWTSGDENSLPKSCGSNTIWGWCTLSWVHCHLSKVLSPLSCSALAASSSSGSSSNTESQKWWFPVCVYSELNGSYSLLT